MGIVLQCYYIHSLLLVLNLTRCCVQISTCQNKGTTRIDLFVCDDIKAGKSLFYSPRRLNKGEVFSVSGSRLWNAGALQLRWSSTKVFMEGIQPTGDAVLNDLAEKREPRSSLPCRFLTRVSTARGNYLAEDIVKWIWQLQLQWGWSMAAVLACIFCTITGPYVTKDLGLFGCESRLGEVDGYWFEILREAMKTSSYSKRGSG